jgi:hypothetical protein
LDDEVQRVLGIAHPAQNVDHLRVELRAVNHNKADRWTVSVTLQCTVECLTAQRAQYLALLDDLVGLLEWIDGLDEERLQLLVVVFGVELQLEQRVLLAEVRVWEESAATRTHQATDRLHKEDDYDQPLRKRAWR